MAWKIDRKTPYPLNGPLPPNDTTIAWEMYPQVIMLNSTPTLYLVGLPRLVCPPAESGSRSMGGATPAQERDVESMGESSDRP
eukprot:400468-Hanusia_phi.AAC.1